MGSLDFSQKVKAIINKRNWLKCTGQYEKYKRYKEVIDYCYKSMSYEYQRILRKCFLNESFKFWWVDEYAKSNFYRKKIKTATAFVKLFEMKYESFNDYSN